MTLEQLKQDIVQVKVYNGITVLECPDNEFVPLQYMMYLRDKGIDIQYVEDISNIVSSGKGLFGSTIDTDTLYVYRTETFDYPLTDKSIRNVESKHLYVICKKVDKKNKELLADNIITIPKLLAWQVKDLAYSMADGADESDIDMLYNVCKGDIFRLNNELEKINIFAEVERKSVLKDFINDGIFSDLSVHNIFDFSNAIIKHDVNSLRVLYRELDLIDCEPLGLVTILINNFKNIIKIQCSNNPTPENTGIESKRFWAIKHSCGIYNRDQLIKIYQMLLSLDKKLKTGEMPTDMMVDYIVTFIFDL